MPDVSSAIVSGTTIYGTSVSGTSVSGTCVSGTGVNRLQHLPRQLHVTLRQQHLWQHQARRHHQDDAS